MYETRGNENKPVASLRASACGSPRSHQFATRDPRQLHSCQQGWGAALDLYVRDTPTHVNHKKHSRESSKNELTHARFHTPTHNNPLSHALLTPTNAWNAHSLALIYSLTHSLCTTNPVLSVTHASSARKTILGENFVLWSG